MSGNIKKFSTGAVRSSDADSVRYDLISPIALRRLAETYAEGAKKYGPNNWLKGIPVSDLLNHALRHINLWMSDDCTEDHLAHAVWNLCSIMHFEETRPDLFDVAGPLPRDELIMVVERDRLEMWERSIYEGNGGKFILRDSLPEYLQVSFRIRTKELEENPELLQVVSYNVCIFERDGEPYLLAYSRAGKEGRLHGKWSLGIGGHVNMGDYVAGLQRSSLIEQSVDPAHLSPSGLWVATKREVEEELGIPISEYDCLFKGMIVFPNDKSVDLVNRVHLGLVSLVYLRGDEENIKFGEEIVEHKFLRMKDLAEDSEFYESLEDWSKLLYRKMVQKEFTF